MSLPIPSHLWQRIQEFAEGKRTGAITLNFNEGRVESFDIREHGRITKTMNMLDKPEHPLVDY